MQVVILSNRWRRRIWWRGFVHGITHLFAGPAASRAYARSVVDTEIARALTEGEIIPAPTTHRSCSADAERNEPNTPEEGTR